MRIKHEVVEYRYYELSPEDYVGLKQEFLDSGWTTDPWDEDNDDHIDYEFCAWYVGEYLWYETEDIYEDRNDFMGVEWFNGETEKVKQLNRKEKLKNLSAVRKEDYEAL